MTSEDLLDGVHSTREGHRRSASRSDATCSRQKIRQAICEYRLVLWRSFFGRGGVGVRIRLQLVDERLPRDSENLRCARAIAFRFIENAEDVLLLHLRERLHVLGHETMNARHSRGLANLLRKVLGKDEL